MERIVPRPLHGPTLALRYFLEITRETNIGHPMIDEYVDLYHFVCRKFMLMSLFDLTTQVAFNHNV